MKVELKKAELKMRVNKLVAKLKFLADDAYRFSYSGWKRYRGGNRNGMVRNWHEMTMRSIAATKKKLDRLQREYASLK